ncbi:MULTISPECIES: hypothetical protein [unclassified Streptomyces]|uniref:hypothetical protein n=1 Tax=unclassified Streptomyces TaxID=2593676 RepID=UPI00224D0D08|nr:MULTISPECIES: hypothetical protein [unclassified Streptomyces]MCX5336438.1 hypothetical protein [Streptomyces sp. NBC_00140]MCX5367164.1 hypothetical protein [Streptomyces sp. NBC_00124]
MNTLPPPPDPLLLPVRDPRARDLVLDYADMHALVADLVLPGDASMYVMSAMETSRELIRHSYYRYEFATVAVTHSLFALEHVLAERLATKEPLHVLIERAADAGLIMAGLAAELDRSRLLRDKLMQGSESSAALHPLRAVAMVRAVFDAVSLLLRPPSTAEATAADEDGAQPDGGLARLWEDHLHALFPDGFRGVDFDGVDLVLLDADVAGLVQRELKGVLDDSGIAYLWGCIADLDKIIPLINEEYCASYFTKLRTMAQVAAAPYIPTAT